LDLTGKKLPIIGLLIFPPETPKEPENGEP